MLDLSFEERMRPSLDRMRLMSVTHLVALHESLVTLKDVAVALTSRQTFTAAPGSISTLSDAGAFVDEIFDDLGMKAEAAIEALRAARACNNFEVEMRARTLIQHSAVYDDNIPEVAATAAALAVPERHTH